MQVNATAIEFFAFIALAVWLVLIRPLSSRPKPDEAAPTAGPNQEAAQSTKPPDRP